MLMQILAQLVALALGVFGEQSGASGLPAGGSVLRAGDGSARVSAPWVEPVVQPTVAPDGGELIPRYHGLDFDGIDDYATIAPSFVLDTSRPWTVAAWVRLESFNHLYQGIIQLRTDQSSGFQITFSADEAPNYRGICFGSHANFVRLKDDTPSSSLTGAWHHLAIVYNGNGRTVAGNYAAHLDGTSRPLNAAAAFSTVPNASCLGVCATNSFNGMIAQVRIWQAALGTGDVRAEMRSATPVRAGAVLVCALRPGVGQAVPLAQVIRDESGNEHIVTRGANASIGDDDPAWVPAAGWTAVGASGPF